MHMEMSGLGEVLRLAFAGRARWPPAVRADLLRAATRVAGLRALATGTFAEVVELEPDEDVEVEDLRLETMTRAELRLKPTKNRGEAECVVVCARLGLPLVVHDEVGRAWGRQRGVRLASLADCLCVATRLGILKPAKAWSAYLRVCDDGMIPLAAYSPDPSGRLVFMARVEPLYSLHVSNPLPAK